MARAREREEAGLGDWADVYKSRLTTAEDAVKVVRPGDLVVYSILPPTSLQTALFARREELNEVTIRLLAPTFDPGWLQAGSEDKFNIEFELFIGDFARFAMDERRGTYLPNLFSLGMKPYDEGRPDVRLPDVAMVTVSPPNKQGYCHFGPHHWTKRAYARRAKTVLAEVDSSLITVHGDCYVHVSQIDAFVEVTPPALTREEYEKALEGLDSEQRADWMALWDELPNPDRLAPITAVMKVVSVDDVRRLFGLDEPQEYVRTIASYLNELIRDRDTIQIGVGDPSRLMTRAGAFDGKRDLGLHTELGSPDLGRLVQEGIVTGRYKPIHREKAVATAWTGCTEQDMEIIDDNPAFELHDPEHILSPRVLAQLDNFVSVNNALNVDLLGQINAESVFGGRMINGTGGQPEMHLAAAMSRGGRAVTLVPSTALDGGVSRIVPQMEAGSLITIPRYYADIVISEYGVARLFGKNHRQRAEELIAIAHPDFRPELRQEARKLWWP